MYGLTFRESVRAARKRLEEERASIRAQHDSGSPGIQVCNRLASLLDEVLVGLFAASRAELTSQDASALSEQVALVAHGGYGRNDVAPYSDVDLMILHHGQTGPALEHLAKRFLRDVFDSGLMLGQAVRTPKEACQLALHDASIATSLMESRLLVGSESLFRGFQEEFLNATQRRQRALIESIDKSRRDERSQFGETVYLLEPNIKRSRGGLRDIQLLRWIGFARYGVADPYELQLRGHLRQADERQIRQALEFLLRLRNELHFHAEKSNDVLERTEQMRIAELHGFKGTEGILPVEQFMSEYFRHTTGVRSVVSEFLASARPQSFVSSALGAFFGQQIEGDYRVTRNHIAATKRGLTKLRGSLREVLRLADIANLRDKRIAPATWQAVRDAMPNFSHEVDEETSRSFLSLLSQPSRLGELLHRLHDLGALEKIIPAFGHARCLLQFNAYHKYTVDEHCIRAVECATNFIADTGTLGRVYRRLRNKATLHLALLIHDLGKGYVEDHSEVGVRIAAETARLLRLPMREAEKLKFLVHKHLLMAHLAFRRDTSDPELVLRFAMEVGSPEVLDMLYVLTAADISAVGPDVWNSWKSEVLTSLHENTMRHLAGDAPDAESNERLQKQHAAIAKLLAADIDQNWYDRQVRALPPAYLITTPADAVAASLRDLHAIGPRDVRARGRYLPESGVIEYVVGTHEAITRGIFYKLTGALASTGLEILSAEIHTLADGLVFDRFYVHDPDFTSAPPPDRIDQVCRALEESLLSQKGDLPTFRKLWQSTSSRGAAIAELPTQVRVDNDFSERFTIIDVFTHDRMGLLHTISRTIFEAGLSVSVAKIGTYLDQVVDVFYVSDDSGAKLTDEAKIHELSAKLREAIESMST